MAEQGSYELLPKTPRPAVQQVSLDDRDAPISPLLPTHPASTLQSPKGKTSKFRLVFSVWSLELGSLLLSLLSFACLVTLLFVYDREPISKWTKFPLSLNAVISILGAITKASLAFVVSMCLSQCKWNWVGNFAEPLVDFDRFDAASRGPWGSGRLLVSMVRRPHWASLGALAALILIAFEPFLQAILTFKDQTVRVDLSELNDVQPTIGSSSVLDAGSWTGTNQIALLNVPFNDSNGKTLLYQATVGRKVRVDMGMTAAIWSGFSYLVTAENLSPSFSCRTGNCTWANYTSLALCSKCQDISQYVKKTSGVIKVPDGISSSGWVLKKGEKLPDVSNTIPEANMRVVGEKLDYTKYTVPGINLKISNYNGKTRRESDEDSNYPDTYLTTTATTNPGKTLSFRDSRTLALAIQYFQADETWQDNKTTWEDTPVTAKECGLYFCVNEYESVVEQGVLNEKVLASWANKTVDSYTDSEGAQKEYMKYKNNSLDLAPGYVMVPDLQIYIPDKDFRSRSANLTQQTFNISQTTVVSLIESLKEGFCARSRNGTECDWENQVLVYPSLPGDGPPGFMFALGESTDIPGTIENVGLSVTKWMRDRKSKSSPVTGEETRSIVITRVRWAYLAYPTATLLVGFIFAALAIWESSNLKRPVWKDSALATLAYSPDGEFRERLKEAAVSGKLSEVARNTNVSLEYQMGHGKIVSRGERKQSAEIPC
ncbi:hypothetical protein BHE90_007760 [Fusarium euwallaceae]|uniref:Uncharacterized protein n=2 Tax=Fusarium solani species complex TaxID=232080 RepID=A0A430LPU5_9HYPO|nr:hypothetical protein BHE90_007760 [Fusarium euwallaceae]